MMKTKRLIVISYEDGFPRWILEGDTGKSEVLLRMEFAAHKGWERGRPEWMSLDAYKFSYMDFLVNEKGFKGVDYSMF